MSELNMQFVREFFELHLFHVLTHWQHQEIPQTGDVGSLLFVERSHAEPLGPPDFLINPSDIGALQRAVIEVRAWHADRVYPSLVEANPVFGHVAQESTRQLAASVLGGPDFATILVVSELPSSPEPRQRAIQLLAELGLDHVLEFSAILQDLLNRISPHGNYAPSQTLQTLRLLKRYDLIRRQQLELAFPTQTPLLANVPEVDTAVLPDEARDED